jgi:hypothetical protein
MSGFVVVVLLQVTDGAYCFEDGSRRILWMSERTGFRYVLRFSFFFS